MSIRCVIHVDGRQDEVHRPGGALGGLVEYTLADDTRLDAIRMTVKGKSIVSWTRGAGKQRRVHRGHHDLVIHDGDLLPPGTVVVRAGTHRAAFRIDIPRDVPPTYRDRHCTIDYYMKIIFSRPGLFNLAKKFRKTILVGNAIAPTLPTTPADYWLEKKVNELFRNDSSRIRLKVNLSKSCMKPGEVIDMSFEVDNATKHMIPSITSRLMEKRIYRSDVGHEKITAKKIKHCSCNTGFVQRKDRGQFALKFCSPLDAFTVQSSRVFSREYSIRVVVKLPMPHRDGVMDIPVQIGEPPETTPAPRPEEVVPLDDPPPSYWEVMVEDMKHSKNILDSD